MVASQIKFHASYLSVLLYSFGFWQFGKLGHVIAVVLWCYVPCGVLDSVIPPDAARPLRTRPHDLLRFRLRVVGASVLRAGENGEPPAAWARVVNGRRRPLASEKPERVSAMPLTIVTIASKDFLLAMLFVLAGPRKTHRPATLRCPRGRIACRPFCCRPSRHSNWLRAQLC